MTHVWSAALIMSGVMAIALAGWALFSVRRSVAPILVEPDPTPAPNPDAELHKLMSQAPIAYYELDESGRFTFVNEKEGELRGLAVGEIQGKYVWELEVPGM